MLDDLVRKKVFFSDGSIKISAVVKVKKGGGSKYNNRIQRTTKSVTIFAEAKIAPLLVAC